MAVVDGLVGRDVELGLLRRLVDEVGGGRGGVVWVEGEPGIGKSRLVEGALSRASVLGVRVFWALGDGLRPALPLQFLADGLRVGRFDGFRVEIADLLAGRGGVSDAVLAAGERMVGLVERECASSPVVLVGDDLQWVDEASMAVWHRLADVAAQAPLLLMGVCRPVPSRAVVDRLRADMRRRAGSMQLELAPLGDAAVVQMARALLGAVPGPGLRVDLALAGGNPLYVREMVDVLVGEGLVRVADGLAEVADEPGRVVGSLGAAIGHRLGFLSSQTRSVLRAGAVLGMRFTTSELAMMCGLALPALSPMVEEALRAGVLVDAEPELMFRHPLIRHVLHDEVPGAMRIGLHGHAARELAEADASWDRVARHLLAAPETIDGWALDWLAGLPSAALLALPTVAAELLSRARQVTVAGDARRAIFSARLTTALRLARRPDELIGVGTEALATVTEPALVGEIAFNLARGHQIRSPDGQSLAVIDRVLAGPDPGAPWRSRLLAQKALLLARLNEVDESRSQAALAIEAGNRDNDPITIGWAHNALLLTTTGAEALDVVERGLAAVVGDDPESIDLRMLLLQNRLIVLLNMDRHIEFEAALAPTLMLAETVGTSRRTNLHVTAAFYHHDRGDWDQALLHLDQADPRVAEDAWEKHGLAALIHARRGQPALAAEHLAMVADIDPADIGLLSKNDYAIQAGAILAEAAGDLSAAIDALSVWLAPSIEQNPHLRVVRADYLPELVRLALAQGDGDLARTAAQTSQADAAAVIDLDVTFVAGMCRGMIEGDPAPLQAASDHFQALGRRLMTGLAAEEATIQFAHAADFDAAKTAFARAVAAYEQLGAAFDLRRLRARARPYGIRRGPRGPRPAATTGWESLTVTERNIAALVAQGQSNPEIAAQLYLSRRTIEAHVAHILRKLQARRRSDVMREAFKHEAAAD